jgi:hypothetical protein
MNKPLKYLGLLAVTFGLSIGASRAIAAPVQITVADNDSTLWGFNGAGSLTAGGTSGAGNFGIAHEDNETEGGTIAGQQWDMEAFVLNGSKLSIIAGFDLLNGDSGHNIGPGDLFIKVGGANPGFAPTNPGAANVPNSTYNYTYAIDLSPATRFTNSSFGPTAQVYTLGANTVLNTTIYDQFGSNPWKYDNTNAGTGFGTGITYQTGLADNSAVLAALGVSLQGGYHNVLTIDLGFLSVAAGNTVYFSYTMECGNDSLKGQYAGGFDRVPDGGTSALLIGLGLAAMAVVGLKRRQG